MRAFTLSIIALVLSLSLQGFRRNTSSDFELFGHDSLSALPQFNVNHAQTRDGKSSSKLNLITQVSIDFSSSLSTDYKLPPSFAYYLPIYSLNRKKEYFLLI